MSDRGLLELEEADSYISFLLEPGDDILASTVTNLAGNDNQSDNYVGTADSWRQSKTGSSPQRICFLEQPKATYQMLLCLSDAGCLIQSDDIFYQSEATY